MSTNEDNKNLIKPQIKKHEMNVKPMRVLSTGYSSINDTGDSEKNLKSNDKNNTTNEKISDAPKLNIAAKSFIPKSKNAETSEVKTQTNQIPYPQPYVSPNQQFYYSNQPNSMIGSTYLGSAMYSQPFIPTNNPQPIFVPVNPQIYNSPYPTYPMYNSVKPTPLNPININNDKKHTINKDSKPYYPKSFGGKTAENLEEKKEENAEEGNKKEENVQEEKQEIKEKEENKKDETKEKEDINNKIVENLKKIEKEEQEILINKKNNELNKENIVAENEETNNENVIQNKENVSVSVNDEDKQTMKNETNDQQKKSNLNSLFSNISSTPSVKIVPVKKNINVTSNTNKTTTKNPKNQTKDFLEKKQKELKMREEENKQKDAQKKPLYKPIEKHIVTKDEPKEDSEQSYTSDEEEAPTKKEEKFTIERHYFKVKESREETKSTRIYNVEYLLSFKDWKISTENKLLNNMLLEHIESMEGFITEDKGGRQGKYTKKPDNVKLNKKEEEQKHFQRLSSQNKETAFVRSVIKLDQKPTDLLTGQWGRKDHTKANEEADKYRTEKEEFNKKDPIRLELIELLNMLTVDNYDVIKSRVLEIIKSEIIEQEKFLEVLFKKAVSEKAFVTLYAKLCKEIDKEVPQKQAEKVAEVKGKPQQLPSIFRGKLLDKCKEIFKLENNEKIDHYIKVLDPDERMAKLKKFLLGNVNFIGELINTRLLSKKIVFQCLSNLFSRMEKKDTETNLREIYILGMVTLLDKFGTNLNKFDHKIKQEEFDEYNTKLDDYISKLDEIQENDSLLPGHVKYTVINLIEKRKRNWEESKLDKTTVAKGLKEVKEEYDNELKGITSGGKNNSNKLEQDQITSIIEADLKTWKIHLDNGNDYHNYDWQRTELLFKKNKNTFGDFLTSFGDACIGFIQNEKDLEKAYLYAREICTYYCKKFPDKQEIVDVVNFFLSQMNEFMIDNHYIVSIWGAVIYLLELERCYRFHDLDKITDVEDEDQIRAIYEVFYTTICYYDYNKDKIKELSETNFVKSNKNIFTNLIGNEN